MTSTPVSKWHDAVIAIGYALGVSYPVLALSTGVRSLYQLFLKEGVTNYLPPLLSALAAICYLTAAVGFFRRRPWAWRLSAGMLTIETALTLVVGSLSLVIPDVIGRTVWGRFGADYGYFPFFQPLLGLIWLWWPATRREYGIGKPKEAVRDEG